MLEERSRQFLHSNAEWDGTLDGLKSKSHVEVFFGEARGRGRSVEKAPADAGPQQDRLGVVERKLDQTIESLESLRRELKR
jgi:hypothetical protein